MFAHNVQVTQGLPAAAAGAASRLLMVKSDAGNQQVPMTAASTSCTFLVPRNSNVTIQLADLDSAGNYLALSSLGSFMATTGAAPASLGTLSPPTVTELAATGTRLGGH